MTIGNKILAKKRWLTLLVILLMLPVISSFFIVKLRFLFPWSIRSRIEMIVSQGDLLDKRIGLAKPDKEISFQSQGLKIVGDLYLPSQKGRNFPGILLLHGSSRWGRKVAMCQLLAKKLSDRGYVVFLIDFRGFGDSEDPREIRKVESWDTRHDIDSAISYLASSGLVDNQAIYLVGHSMGASYGIKTAIEDERIKKIAAIGPGRRFLERFPDEKESFLHRFSRDRRLDSLIPMDVYYTHSEFFTVENTFHYFKQDKSKPLLLIDGELESVADKKFLREYYSQMVAAHSYVTISETGHYFNVVGFEKFENFPIIKDLYIYDRKVIEDSVKVIDTFFKLQGNEYE